MPCANVCYIASATFMRRRRSDRGSQRVVAVVTGPVRMPRVILNTVGKFWGSYICCQKIIILVIKTHLKMSENQWIFTIFVAKMTPLGAAVGGCRVSYLSSGISQPVFHALQLSYIMEKMRNHHFRALIKLSEHF